MKVIASSRVSLCRSSWCQFTKKLSPKWHLNSSHLEWQRWESTLDLRSYKTVNKYFTCKIHNFKSFLTADGEIEFKCQHGKQEVCSLTSDENLLSFKTYFKLLFQVWRKQISIVRTTSQPTAGSPSGNRFCTMTPHHFYGDCIEELNLDGDKIYECFNGTLGTILQLFAESKSMRVLDQLQGVPAIVFNGEVDTSSSFSSLNSFEKVLESKIDRSHSPKSSKCNE